MKYRLERVHYMPKELEPWVLYVSEEFKTAAHLCACGCGEKIRTPLRPTEWKLVETDRGPSLIPSVGNWQKPCQSHYWITEGDVVWSGKWTEAQIEFGRAQEAARRSDYYEAANQEKSGFFVRVWNFVKGLFKRR